MDKEFSLRFFKKFKSYFPEFPLVLHGGSSINLDDIKKINNNGGKLNEMAAGVNDDDIIRSISFGICKINIATDTRILWTRVHREFFKEEPDQFDPIIPGKQYMEEYEIYGRKIRSFESNRKSNSI